VQAPSGDAPTEEMLKGDVWFPELKSQGNVLARGVPSDPGGPYDVKQVIAQGFCGFHHHQVSGLTLGIDGWLYITSGDDDNYVEGSDGSRATVLRTGAVFRCRPDGSKMHVWSIGYRLIDSATGTVVYTTTLTTPGTATLDDAYRSDARLRIADDRAVRANFRRLVEELYALPDRPITSSPRT